MRGFTTGLVAFGSLLLGFALSTEGAQAMGRSSITASQHKVCNSLVAQKGLKGAARQDARFKCYEDPQNYK